MNALVLLVYHSLSDIGWPDLLSSFLKKMPHDAQSITYWHATGVNRSTTASTLTSGKIARLNLILDLFATHTPYDPTHIYNGMELMRYTRLGQRYMRMQLLQTTLLQCSSIEIAKAEIQSWIPDLAANTEKMILLKQASTIEELQGICNTLLENTTKALKHQIALILNLQGLNRNDEKLLDMYKKLQEYSNIRVKTYTEAPEDRVSRANTAVTGLTMPDIGSLERLVRKTIPQEYTSNPPAQLYDPLKGNPHTQIHIVDIETFAEETMAPRFKNLPQALHAITVHLSICTRELGQIMGCGPIDPMNHSAVKKRPLYDPYIDKEQLLSMLPNLLRYVKDFSHLSRSQLLGRPGHEALRRLITDRIYLAHRFSHNTRAQMNTQPIFPQVKQAIKTLNTKKKKKRKPAKKPTDNQGPAETNIQKISEGPELPQPTAATNDSKIREHNKRTAPDYRNAYRGHI